MDIAKYGVLMIVCWVLGCVVWHMQSLTFLLPVTSAPTAVNFSHVEGGDSILFQNVITNLLYYVV
jgi:hypothetical protein